MRFRLSTLLLTLALVSVVFGWGMSEWRRKTSHANEYVVASEFARFKAYNDVYRSIDKIKLSADEDRVRRRLLQNTIKSTPYILALPLPDRHEILSYEYKSAFRRIALDALNLLEIDSPDGFQAAIIADGEYSLLDWERQNPDKKLVVQVIDPNTRNLKPEFAEFLKSVLELGESSDNP